MENMDNNTENNDLIKDVRDRLLDAAEDCFAEKGFEGTNIRDLTQKANSNIAAVNYHFGGKENLYIEVFRRRMSVMMDVRISSINSVLEQQNNGLVLEELLRAFAMAFIEPFQKQSSSHRFTKLMIREMLDPHLPKSLFINELAAPTMKAFGNAMSRIYPELEKKKMVLLTISLVGQLLHFMHINEIFGSNKPDELPVGNLNEIIEHVVSFTAVGIRSMVEGK
ncbi:MAG: CerR family C-terminal domain-containing protein [Planctomycetota bacterium]|jgi:AcrR family transcriptional regulator